MPKIRKRTSKRIGFREKYAVKKKVAEHHRKMRKTSKKLSQQGIKPKPGKNNMVIPNAFPGKEQLLNEMEMAQKMERESRKNRISNIAEADKSMKDESNYQFEQSLIAPVNKQEEDPTAKTGGLTEQDLKDAEMLMDPETQVR